MEVQLLLHFVHQIGVWEGFELPIDSGEAVGQEIELGLEVRLHQSRNLTHDLLLLAFQLLVHAGVQLTNDRLLLLGHQLGDGLQVFFV